MTLVIPFTSPRAAERLAGGRGTVFMTHTYIITLPDKLKFVVSFGA